MTANLSTVSRYSGSHALVSQMARQVRIETLLNQLREWTAQSGTCQVDREQSRLIQAVLERSGDLLARLEAPLVVATFGGTGVGKSSLINALVGAVVAPTGRQRPTTRVPTLIAHDTTLLSAVGFPEATTADVRVVRLPLPMLKRFVLLDCPDPDTDETDDTGLAAAGSNLARLRELLPRCDVLLVVSTQEQYLEARVQTELAAAARHCRLVFVQTRADLDDDIRPHWRSRLGESFEIHDLFWIDSRQALVEQQTDIPLTGEFGRLVALLERETVDGARSRVRHANILDLTCLVLQEGVSRYALVTPALQQLQQKIQQQNQWLVQRLSERMGRELSAGRAVWEQRLLEEIAQRWGTSPFSLLLRARTHWTSLFASWALLRSRSVVQAVLVGGAHLADWVRQADARAAAGAAIDQLPAGVVSDVELRQAALLIDGYALAAGLETAAGRAGIDHALQAIRSAAEQTQARLVERTRTLVDELISSLAQDNAGPLLRWPLEVLFAVYPLFVLGLVVKNFFYDAFWFGRAYLDMGFYLPAGLLLLLWCGLFLWFFLGRLQRGLQQRVRAVARELAAAQWPDGLFGTQQTAATTALERQARLERALAEGQELQQELRVAPGGWSSAVR